jgi:OHCU decarboxylase
LVLGLGHTPFTEMSITSLTPDEIFSCCACRAYASALAAATMPSPCPSVDQVIELSRRQWWNHTPVTGWLEAFAAHPRIGRVPSVTADPFAKMSVDEQGNAVRSASDPVLQLLVEWNEKYEEKFGHIFIIYASGKSASLMLEALQTR